MRTHLLALSLLPLAMACKDVKEGEGHDHHHHDHNHGLTTAVVLDFTPESGDTLSFTWEDPTADGANIKIDDIELMSGVSYDLGVRVLNQLEEPVEDVTAEILEQAEEHQFFFTGSAVSGPASDSDAAPLQHTYNDVDADGLPLGIDNLMDAVSTGDGELTVTLRHLPPESGAATKVEGLADTVQTGGFAAIGGDTDVEVTFPVTVN